MNRVIREWTLVEELGRGDLGVVYKATHKFLPGHFAIKAIKPELAQDPEVHSRFLQEAHNANRLKHPNVVDTQAPFEDEGSLYLPMEYLDGVPLNELLSQHPQGMDPTEALKILGQAAAGIGYAHAQGIVHRDVKPANIFVTASGQVKVLDFGLTKGVGDKSLTADGLAVGAPVYIAPEIYNGKSPTPAADVYSLGIIGFKLLTGALPIEMPENDASLVAIVSTMMQAHAQGLPSVAAASSGIEPWVDSLIASMMVVDPAKRLQDGQAVSDGITSQGIGGNAVAPAPSSAQATTQAPQSRPAQNESPTSVALPTMGHDIPPPSTSNAQEQQTQFAMPKLSGGQEQESLEEPIREATPPPATPQPESDDLEPPESKSRMPLIAALVLVIGGGGGYAAYDYKLEQDRLAAEKLAAAQTEVKRLTDACSQGKLSDCETLSRAYIQGELSLAPSPSKPNELLYSKCKDGQPQEACDILSKLCAELKTKEVCAQLETHQALMKQANDFILQGNQSLEKRQVPAARRAFNQALELVPKAPEALLGLGRVAVLENKTDAAIALFTDALGHQEVFPEVYESVGSLFVSLSDVEGGVKQLEVAERQMLQQNASPRKMDEFYLRVIDILAPKSQRTANIWRKKIGKASTEAPTNNMEMAGIFKTLRGGKGGAISALLDEEPEDTQLAQVQLGSLDLDPDGSVSTSSVEKSLRAANGAFVRCYDKERKKTRSLKGKLEIHMDISETGQVIYALIVGDTTNNEQVGNCILEKMEGMSFPRGNEEYTVLIPLALSF